MRIVILEAVTAGGLGGPVASGSREIVNSAAVPVALRKEALAMVASLTADCCEAIQSHFPNCDLKQALEMKLPNGERCVPWILRSLFSTLSLTAPPIRHKTQFFLHPPDQATLACAPSSHIPFKKLNSDLPIAEPLPSIDDSRYLVECWDPIHEQRLATSRVFLCGSNRWDLPDGKPDATPLCTTTAPEFAHLNVEPIFVTAPSRLVEQWQAAVRDADAAILIAPQPEMQRWISALGSLAHKVLSWPVDLLCRAEDKRHLTHVPSLVVEPHDQLWGFLTNDVVSSTVANQPADPSLQWYATHLATATTWALKPTNQCGGSDVWRISLVAPLPEFASAKRIVQRLRERVPRETFGEQELLWSPWVAGEAGSLSLLATPTGWWCFPPCRQILKFEEVPVPCELLPWVKQLHKVNYVGSELDPQLLTSGTVDLLWRQFAAKLEHRERLSIRGWFGIDFVAATPEQATLIEVNPRLTSSYNLLRQLRWA